LIAILADFKGENKEKVIQKIILALKDKTKNKRRLQKLIMQLEILSNLRNLQPIIKKQLSTMSIHYDVTKDLRYLQGEEKGEEKGKNEKAIEVVLKGFENGISLSLLSNISGFSEAQVIAILKENNLM
jgi:hypothetical protein